MPYVNIRIRKETYEKLKELAAGRPLVQFIDSLLEDKPTETLDEGERLLEELDNKNEHPEDYMSEEDKAVLRGLGPGELPECCQRIYDDPEHIDMSLACGHWEKAYVNHYGNRIWHLRNKLTGGSYFDYFNKYVGA